MEISISSNEYLHLILHYFSIPRSISAIKNQHLKTMIHCFEFNKHHVAKTSTKISLKSLFHQNQRENFYSQREHQFSFCIDAITIIIYISILFVL